MTAATRQKLALLKSSSGETYHGLINKLLSLVPEGDEEGRYTHAFRVGLLRARVEVMEGRGIPPVQVERRVGLLGTPGWIILTDQAGTGRGLVHSAVEWRRDHKRDW